MGESSDSFGPDRIRSHVKQHAKRRSPAGSAGGDGILPKYNRTPSSASNVNHHKAGGLTNALNDVPASPEPPADDGAPGADRGGVNARRRKPGSGPQETFDQNRAAEGSPPSSLEHAAPPPHKSEDTASGSSTLGGSEARRPSDPSPNRFWARCKQTCLDLYHGICYSWINVLLVFVPVGIAVEAVGLQPAVIFALNAVAIVPLAGLLSHATEAVASRLGDTLGALLNVSFGNAVELIIFIIALVKDEISIVQASLLGSILANLLLILGMAFLFGGLRFREQLYNSTVTQMSACLLSLSVMSLLLPTAFHASFSDSATADAESHTLAVSRGTSVVLLVVYVLYLLFQLKSHAYMYESTPQAVIDEESHPGVLADMLNSSSSSSSSDDDDDDSSGSGSIVKRTKKLRRRLRNRRRRASSTGSDSTDTASPPAVSTLSSPSTELHGEYLDRNASTAASAVGPNARLDTEADAEDEDGNATRVRDFVPRSPERSKSAGDDKKSHRRQSKKLHPPKTQSSTAEPELEKATVDEANQAKAVPSRVGFAESVEVAEAAPSGQPQGGRAFNLRTAFPRPQLPKMLSNNVFVTPPPQQSGSTRAAPATIRLDSGYPALRRTSSLPAPVPQQDNRPSAPSRQVNEAASLVPLPPYSRNARTLSNVTSEEAEGGGDDQPDMSRTSAVIMLLLSTALVAVCAEFMVDAIPRMMASSSVSEAFIGLIILPIVGNAAEHVTAVTVATKNKMDLAIGVAVGSSIQIALFVTPIVVLLGWILNTNMSLYFNLFETVSLFVTAFVVNFLVLDGRSNYLEGSLLIAAYIIIALGAFFYPAQRNQSDVGGGDADSGGHMSRMVAMMF